MDDHAIAYYAADEGIGNMAASREADVEGPNYHGGWLESDDIEES